MIDISLAAKGMSSTVSEGAQQQTLPYPGTFYQFDPCIFHGQNTELDLDQAENLNLVENRLYATMKLPSTVDGCRIVMKQRSLKVTCHGRRSWTFLYSHGMIMREIQDSHFGPNSVGKLNVSLQSIKHNNSKGAPIRGNCEIGFIILLHSIILLLSLFVIYWKQVLMQWPLRRLRIAWYVIIIRNVNWEKLIRLHGKLCWGKHLPSTKNVQWL